MVKAFHMSNLLWIKNDHPELDNSELASNDLITRFMCMVGQLQFVTLGIYDILSQVMSMSRFRLAPVVGHIVRMKRIYGYLSMTKYYALRFRTDAPNYMHLPSTSFLFEEHQISQSLSFLFWGQVFTPNGLHNLTVVELLHFLFHGRVAAFPEHL